MNTMAVEDLLKPFRDKQAVRTSLVEVDKLLYVRVDAQPLVADIKLNMYTNPYEAWIEHRGKALAYDKRIQAISDIFGVSLSTDLEGDILNYFTRGTLPLFSAQDSQSHKPILTLQK